MGDSHDESRKIEPCPGDPATDIEVPADFWIRYKAGPVHAERGESYRLDVGAEGRVDIVVSDGTRGGGEATVSTLSSEELRQVYARATACGFFELSEYYSDPDVVGGWVEGLRVVAHRRDHIVLLHHVRVRRFEAIRDLLMELVPEAKERFFPPVADPFGPGS